MKVAIAFLMSMLSVSAFAAGHDWKKCAAEVKKFHCRGFDEAIYQCLVKHDEDLKKSKCNEARVAFEDANKK